ncbi:MAG: efflux transporter periplasmic adaptor subunit, partial [Azorhizobium sp. 39-67-5]
MPRLARSAPTTPSRRPALPHRLLVGALFAGALAAGQFIPPALAEAPAAEAVKGLTVSVTHPEKREMVETLLVTGSLIAREEIQVGPEIEGYRLTEILAEVGDRVKQGQVLARLNREVLETQLAQNTANRAKAKAAIAQQRANLDQMLAQEAEATSAVERSRQLRKTGVVSQETLDERERAVKVASAQVAK